jgi:signal transduction histidine kinase
VTLAITWLQPAWSRASVRVVLVFTEFAVAAATATVPTRFVSLQPVVALGVLPLFALLLDGMFSVVTVSALSLVAIAWVGLNVTFAGANAFHGLSNAALGVIFAAVALSAEARASRHLRDRAAALAAERDRALADVETLNRLLFSEFRALIERLAPLLQAGPAQLPAVRTIAVEMRVLLERGRAVVLRAGDAPPLERFTLTERELRTRSATPVALALTFAYSMALLRNVLTRGPVLPNVVALATYSIVLTPWGRRPGRLLGSAMACVLVVCTYLAMNEWAFAPDAPVLMAQPSLAFIVYWLLGMEAVVLWMAGNFAQLLLFYVPHDPRNLEPAIAVIVFTLAAVGACALYWRNLRADLARLDQRALAADDAARERRRLTTTFFHDQANLVFALEGSTAPDDPEAASPETFAALSALAARMSAHLKAMGDLAGSGAVPASGLSPVSASALFDGLTVLFREPLARKRQRLLFEGDPALRLRAVPAVLLDSVLSNLVSNALKFTPEGGTIRLCADLRGAEVELRVCDEGAGMPPAVLAGLSDSDRLPSQTGSAGETGNGFGLVLARQTAQRMGGALELGAPARGAEVRLRFPSAGT